MEAIRRAHPLPGVVAKIVPLRRSGSEWVAQCPFHQDRTPSFTVYDGGNRFKCFGCGAAGDVLDFIQRAYGLTLIEAARQLDGGNVPAIPMICPQGDGGTRDRRQTQVAAVAIWERAAPAAGTPAEAYLRLRGLLPPYPPSLGFTELPCGDFGPMPCLVAAVRNVAGEVTGVQRIWLAPGGQGKAPVAKPKRSLGTIRGGAIRLAEPGAEGVLAICEGPETGLSLQRLLGLPVWVAAGASFLPAMAFPPAVRSLIIGADNDAAGLAAARKAALAFAGRGLIVRIVHPLDGYDDFNSELMGAGK
jgi:DNA primase